MLLRTITVLVLSDFKLQKLGSPQSSQTQLSYSLSIHACSWQMINQQSLQEFCVLQPLAVVAVVHLPTSLGTSIPVYK